MPFPPVRLMSWTAGRTDHLVVKFEEEIERFKSCPEYETTQQKLRACIQAEVNGLLARNEEENIRKFARLTQELNASRPYAFSPLRPHGH
jgi:hypothetical protein